MGIVGLASHRRPYDGLTNTPGKHLLRNDYREMGLACKRLPWTFEKAFWCEKDKFARKFIQDNVEPGVPDFHCCQTDEFLTNAPPCDLLLGGFTRQPFSIMGRGDGDVIPSSRHLSSSVQSEAP